MLYGHNILLGLELLGMDAIVSNLLMNYHPVFEPSKQGLRLKIYFL